MVEAVSTPTTPGPSPDLATLLRRPPRDHMDFALLAACGAFLALHERDREVVSQLEGKASFGPVADMARSALISAQGPLLDAICSTRALTPAGLAARCRIMLACDPDVTPEQDALPTPTTFATRRLLAATVRDLLAGVVA